MRLRVPTAEDADAWAGLFDDPAVMRHVGTGEVRDRAWYAAFVRRQRELAAATGRAPSGAVVHQYGRTLAG
ncbi:hypothetical protein DQ238_22165 [Geodermatophilus sp. TF02-6]|nr:hypothetical protein DQ238_22165 [Geodermatophilus sp. TF02-6]